MADLAIAYTASRDQTHTGRWPPFTCGKRSRGNPMRAYKRIAYKGLQGMPFVEGGDEASAYRELDDRTGD